MVAFTIPFVLMFIGLLASAVWQLLGQGPFLEIAFGWTWLFMVVCIAVMVSFWVWLWGGMTVWLSIEAGELRWSRWFTESSAPLGEIVAVSQWPLVPAMFVVEIRDGPWLWIAADQSVVEFIPFLMEQAPQAHIDYQLPQMLEWQLRQDGVSGATMWRREGTIPRF